MRNIANENFNVFKGKLAAVMITKKLNLQLSSRQLSHETGIRITIIENMLNCDYSSINNDHIKIMKYLSIKVDDIIDLKLLYDDIKFFNIDRELFMSNTLDLNTINGILGIINKLKLDLTFYIKDSSKLKSKTKENYKIVIDIPDILEDKLIENIKKYDHNIIEVFSVLMDMYINKPYIINEYLEELEYKENLNKYLELERKIKQYEESKGIVR